MTWRDRLAGLRLGFGLNRWTAAGSASRVSARPVPVQRVAVPLGGGKGIHSCCRRVVRSLAIAPAVDMVHRVWPMIRERSTGGYPGYPVVLVVSGCLMNPVSVMPEWSIRSTSAPDRGASGD